MVVDFMFDGQLLSHFGYMMCSFDQSVDENIVVSEMDYTDISSPLSDVSHKVATSYSNNYQRTIQICKNICDNQEDDELTNDDISELAKWLCRKDYKWFKWVDDEDDDEIFYEVRCTLSKVLLHGVCRGVEITIQSNRPFAVTKPITSIYSLEADSSFKINCFSEEEGYIYPDMTITMRGGGNFELTNVNENRTTAIDNCIADEVITIDGSDILQITSSNSSHSLAKDYNYKFPRLVNEYRNSVNTFSCTLPCIIALTYRGIRKVGL